MIMLPSETLSVPDSVSESGVPEHPGKNDMTKSNTADIAAYITRFIFSTLSPQTGVHYIFGSFLYASVF